MIQLENCIKNTGILWHLAQIRCLKIALNLIEDKMNLSCLFIQGQKACISFTKLSTLKIFPHDYTITKSQDSRDPPTALTCELC